MCIICRLRDGVTDDRDDGNISNMRCTTEKKKVMKYAVTPVTRVTSRAGKKTKLICQNLLIIIHISVAIMSNYREKLTNTLYFEAMFGIGRPKQGVPELKDKGYWTWKDENEMYQKNGDRIMCIGLDAYVKMKNITTARLWKKMDIYADTTPEPCDRCPREDVSVCMSNKCLSEDEQEQCCNCEEVIGEEVVGCSKWRHDDKCCVNCCECDDCVALLQSEDEEST